MTQTRACASNCVCARACNTVSGISLRSMNCINHACRMQPEFLIIAYLVIITITRRKYRRSIYVSNMHRFKLPRTRAVSSLNNSEKLLHRGILSCLSNNVRLLKGTQRHIKRIINKCRCCSVVYILGV